MEQQKKGSNSTLIIVIILAVIVIGLLVLGLVGCGVYYWLKKQTPTSTPTTTSVPSPTDTSSSASTTEIDTPSAVVQKYMRLTLGTIPGAELDYEKAKDYLSAELKELFSDVTFVPVSYCIQQGPEDVKIISEDITSDEMEATIRVSAKWGENWQQPWEFLLIYGSGGWKIKQIKCLDTGQITK